MHYLPLTNRTLGTIGLFGAPLMLLAMTLPKLFPGLENTPFDGLNGLFFMLTWMSSLAGLIRLNATGHSAFGRFIIRANLVTLTLANVWNCYQAMEPEANTLLYRILDAFWPISMVTMLLVGITVALAGRLPGWRRYIPLAVGLWLPVSVLMGTLLGQIDTTIILVSGSAALPYTNLLSGIYATVCWGLLGYVVRSTPAPQRIRRIEAILV